jgi:hypothetical protein
MESSALIAEQFEDETIYEVIEKVLKMANLGFKILVTGLGSSTAPKLYFLVYAGADRSIDQSDNNPVIFSDQFNNLIDSSFLTTEKDKVNVTQVIVDDDETYEMVFVWEGGSTYTSGGTEPSGLNRFEGRLNTSIDRRSAGEGASETTSVPASPTLGLTGGKDCLDAVGISTTPVVGRGKVEGSDTPLTDEETLDIIEERGEAVIKEDTPIAVFDGSADARTQFIIDDDFFLGDIVHVDAHGSSDSARVVEVVKSYSVEGDKIYITFDFEV